MTVSTARDKTIASILQRRGESLCIGNDLRRIDSEVRPESFAECHCLRRNDVYQRATLLPGEHSHIDSLADSLLGLLTDLVVLAAKNHAGTRTAQCLMRSRRGDVRVSNW